MHVQKKKKKKEREKQKKEYAVCMDTMDNVLHTKEHFIRMTAPVGNEVSSRDALHQNDYAISFRSWPSQLSILFLFLTH